jgi:hypothetical protein
LSCQDHRLVGHTIEAASQIAEVSLAFPAMPQPGDTSGRAHIVRGVRLVILSGRSQVPLGIVDRVARLQSTDLPAAAVRLEHSRWMRIPRSHTSDRSGPNRSRNRTGATGASVSVHRSSDSTGSAFSPGSGDWTDAIAIRRTVPVTNDISAVV